MIQLLKATEHMHKYGYFHRDIKPENILVKVSIFYITLKSFGAVLFFLRYYLNKFFIK
jgi:serine/threonine protein kinase